MKVGLTGGIGSGKTTVARIFEVLGIPVYNADDASKRIMNNNQQLKASIIKEFGESVYSDTVLNRGALASAVFNQPERLALLNSLVHPLTIADADLWMSAQKAPYVVKEAALIFESGAHTHLDFLVGVSAPLSLRMQRAINRDGSSAEAVRQRINSQMDEAEKMSRCNFIVNNNEEVLLLPQVMELHELLLKEAKRAGRWYQ